MNQDGFNRYLSLSNQLSTRYARNRDGCLPCGRQSHRLSHSIGLARFTKVRSYPGWGEGGLLSTLDLCASILVS